MHKMSKKAGLSNDRRSLLSYSLATSLNIMVQIQGLIIRHMKTKQNMASIQYFHIKKRVQLSQRNGFVSQHGCHFIVLEHQYSNHDAIVKMLYKRKSSQKKINATSNSHPCPAESDLQFLEILHMFQFQYLNKVTPMIVELNFTYSKS